MLPATTITIKTGSVATTTTMLTPVSSTVSMIVRSFVLHRNWPRSCQS